MPRKQTLFLTLCLGVLVLGASSCSNKATEEQMKLLNQLDRERDGLMQDLDRAKAQLRDSKSKLAAQDKDLSDCNTETQGARQWLSMWPNVWPDSLDWKVAPPPVEAPVKATKKR